MDITKIIQRRSTPGILIFSMTGRFLYANKESLSLLPELRIGVKGISRAFDELQKLCDTVIQCSGKEDGKNCSFNSAVLQNDSGPCYMRAFHLEGTGSPDEPGQILILIEKIVYKHELNLEDLKTEFGLTNREADVARLLCSGFTNKELSKMLLISEYTIKDHIKKLMQKMGVKSRNAIIARLK